jgi:hypothetical protein
VRVDLVANNHDGRYHPLEDAKDTGTAEGASKTGLAVGAAAGGGVGLLAGIAALAVPGVGPLIAAGSIAFALLGVGAGAAAGGLVGALVGAGITPEHADIYAEAIRRGGTLITVAVDDSDRDRVSDIIARYHPVSIDDRRASWDRPPPAIAAHTTASAALADHGASAGSFIGNGSSIPSASMQTGSPPAGDVRVRANPVSREE